MKGLHDDTVLLALGKSLAEVAKLVHKAAPNVHLSGLGGVRHPSGRFVQTPSRLRVDVQARTNVYGPLRGEPSSCATDRQTVIIGTGTRDPHYAISRRSAPLTHAHGGACQQSSPVGRALLLLTLSVAHPSHAPYGSRDSRGVCVRGTREGKREGRAVPVGR